MIVYWMCWFQIDAGQSQCILAQHVLAAAHPNDASLLAHCLSSIKVLAHKECVATAEDAYMLAYVFVQCTMLLTDDVHTMHSMYAYDA